MIDLLLGKWHLYYRLNQGDPVQHKRFRSRSHMDVFRRCVYFSDYTWGN